MSNNKIIVFFFLLTSIQMFAMNREEYLFYSIVMIDDSKKINNFLIKEVKYTTYALDLFYENPILDTLDYFEMVAKNFLISLTRIVIRNNRLNEPTHIGLIDELRKYYPNLKANHNWQIALSYMLGWIEKVRSN